MGLTNDNLNVIKVDVLDPTVSLVLGIFSGLFIVHFVSKMLNVYTAYAVIKKKIRSVDIEPRRKKTKIIFTFHFYLFIIYKSRSRGVKLCVMCSSHQYLSRFFFQSFGDKLVGHDAVVSCLGFAPQKPAVTGYTTATKVKLFYMYMYIIYIM